MEEGKGEVAGVAEGKKVRASGAEGEAKTAKETGGDDGKGKAKKKEGGREDEKANSPEGKKKKKGEGEEVPLLTTSSSSKSPASGGKTALPSTPTAGRSTSSLPAATAKAATVASPKSGELLLEMFTGHRCYTPLSERQPKRAQSSLSLSAGSLPLESRLAPAGKTATAKSAPTTPERSSSSSSSELSVFFVVVVSCVDMSFRRA